MKRTSLAILLSITCALTLYGCKSKKLEEIDLSTIHTTAAQPETETMTPATKTPSEKETTSAAAKPGSKMTAKTETYTNNKITISYPVIADSEDKSNEAAVNKLLRENALSFIKANEIDESKDTLSISCKIISADRKKVTAIYTGTFTPDSASYPVNVFYTNTVDILGVKDIGLHDYADSDTISAYVMSDECLFSDLSAETEKEVRSYLKGLDQAELTELFQNADFPLNPGEDGSISIFPQSFSYEEQGNIYLSVPVLHALGDYALVKFVPETK